MVAKNGQIYAIVEISMNNPDYNKEDKVHPSAVVLL